MKIVLSNAVGRDSDGNYIVHSPSRWSFSMKGYDDVFSYYPWALAYSSSLLKERTDNEVLLIDPCLEHIGREETIERIASEGPDLLVMEPSTRTWAEDSAVMMRVKGMTGASIAVAGPYASAFPKEVSRVADYVMLGEYEETLVEIARGRKKIPGLYPHPLRPPADFAAFPFPEDSDVSRFDYAIPGEPNSEYTEIQMYTSRGCPVSCAFCAARNIYYDRPNWRPRRAVDVVDEMEYLLERYPGTEGFFFDEEEHNANPDHVRSVCAEIRRRGIETRIDAMCLYFRLDEEILDEMALSGYYKLRVGIETASERVAKGMNLGMKFNPERLLFVLSAARDRGIKVYGTFSVGGLGSSPEEDGKTASLIEDLVSGGLLSDIQVSINTPQPGTPFFDEVKGMGALLHEDWSLYDGGRRAVVSYPDYPSSRIEESFRGCLEAYDRGLEKREGRGVRNAAEATAGGLPDGRILLVRSTRLWHSLAVLDGLSAAGRSVDILCQSAVAARVGGHLAGGGSVLTYPEGHLSTETIAPELASRLRDSGYSAVLVPWNNRDGRGYGNVRTLAEGISGRVFGARNDGRIVPWEAGT